MDHLAEPLLAPGTAAEGSVPRRRLLIIHNPTAGTRRLRYLQHIVDALRHHQGAEVIIRATDSPGAATALARAAHPDEADALIVAGGDGTINETVNGLADANGTPGPWVQAGRALAVAPLGTANVLAAELNLPVDPAALADAIVHNPARPMHLGLANGRAFTMMAGVGLDARVVQRVDKQLKRLTGKGAYVIETLAQLLSGRWSHYQVEIDGQTHHVDSAIVANGHYYGGRFVCAPAASPFEPLLHVCLFPSPGRWHALRYLWGFTAGRLKHFPDYHIIPARQVVIHGPNDEVVQGDGDIVAQVPVTINVAPWTLPVVSGLVPGGSGAAG